jgi:hypothetical protein
MILPADQREACLDAALTLDLHRSGRRSILWAGIPSRFEASLAVLPVPLDQLRSDLNVLFSTPQIGGLDGAPVLIWLANAIALSAGHPAVEPLRRAREHLAAPSPFVWRVFLVNRARKLTLAVACDPGWTVQMLIDEAVDRHGLSRVVWHDDFGRDRTRIAYAIEIDTTLGPHVILSDHVENGMTLQLVITLQRLLDDDGLRHLRPAPLDDDEALADVEDRLAVQIDGAMGR